MLHVSPLTDRRSFKAPRSPTQPWWPHPAARFPGRPQLIARGFSLSFCSGSRCASPSLSLPIASILSHPQSPCESPFTLPLQPLFPHLTYSKNAKLQYVSRDVPSLVHQKHTIPKSSRVSSAVPTWWLGKCNLVSCLVARLDCHSAPLEHSDRADHEEKNTRSMYL